ncbi:M48 family metallopeptidase [Candidatus Azambacteria bacterium]|nr:M48 family metallopeptidase [Candidatus Azambacteria bacterium]
MGCDGSVVVTTPFGFAESVAERFIREKARWLFAKISFFKQFEGRVIVRHTKADYAKYKKDAHAFACARVDHFNAMYGFRFNRITIRNQKTRWGSCSRNRNLNFNYKIALLPQRLTDYIIVHELCHLGEFNHSRKFWALVAQAMPDHAELRKELKRNRIMFQ